MKKLCKFCGADSETSEWYAVKGKNIGLVCKKCYNLKKKKDSADRLATPENRIKANEQQKINKAAYRADAEKSKKLNERRREYYAKISTVALRKKASKASAKSAKARKETCSIFASTLRLRKLLHSAFSRLGYKKCSLSHEILGASFEEVMQHLGCPNGIPADHEVDHVLPIALAYDEVSLIRLNHYTNLQLLTLDENRAKRDKLPSGQNASQLTIEEKKVVFLELVL